MLGRGVKPSAVGIWRGGGGGGGGVGTHRPDVPPSLVPINQWGIMVSAWYGLSGRLEIANGAREPDAILTASFEFSKNATTTIQTVGPGVISAMHPVAAVKHFENNGKMAFAKLYAARVRPPKMRRKCRRKSRVQHPTVSKKRKLDLLE